MTVARVLAAITAAGRRHVVITALLLMALVTIADYAGGVDVTFTELTYLLPIVLGTWLRGRRLGIALAVLATACSVGVDIQLAARPSAGTIALDAAGSFGMFLVVIWILEALRHHVAREQLQRRAAVEQLRHAERLNVIGVLAAGVAHELGTPLNVIAGTAELIADEPRSPADLERLARVIIGQTDRISAIIRHLLDFGRRGRTARAHVELARITVATIELLAPTARKRGTEIEVELADPPVRVRANPAELEQVLSNLLINGMQAMPHGGTLRVRTGLDTRPAADGTLQRFGWLAVADEGVGIAEADLPRIFDPFFTTKGIGEGTGLGLSVSYGIVKDHGGTIEVHSAAGRGAEFVVLLPA